MPETPSTLRLFLFWMRRHEIGAVVPSTFHSRMPPETPALSWTTTRSAEVVTALNVTRLKVLSAVPYADAPLTAVHCPAALRYCTCHDCGTRHCPLPVSSNQYTETAPVLIGVA